MIVEKRGSLRSRASIFKRRQAGPGLETNFIAISWSSGRKSIWRGVPEPAIVFSNLPAILSARIFWLSSGEIQEGAPTWPRSAYRNSRRERLFAHVAGRNRTSTDRLAYRRPHGAALDWSHQHFCPGPEPARFIAPKPWGFKYLVEDLAKSDKDEDKAALQIEYDNTDPKIHQILSRRVQSARSGSPNGDVCLIGLGEKRLFSDRDDAYIQKRVIYRHTKQAAINVVDGVKEAGASGVRRGIARRKYSRGH